MAQPTAYARQADFTDHSTNNPTTPHVGVNMDAEFDAILTTLAETLVNLALLQRDDGALANGIVHPDSFTAASLALMGGSWSPEGAWVTATAYVASDVVTEGGAGYVCVTAHTSGTFATDLAAGKWISLGASATAALLALGALTPAADKMPYFTSASAASLLTTTSYGRSLLAVANEAALKALITAEAGTDFQAASAVLTTLAGASANGQSLITAADYAAMKVLLTLTLSVTAGKTAAISNSLTLAGTDGTTLTFPEETASIGFRGVPAQSKSEAYTCVLGDAGKSIDRPATDNIARTFTIPANASVAFPIGTALTFTNMGINGLTIAITTDTMYLAGTGTTGSRTLAQYGIATAPKQTNTTWLIAGSGLT